MSRRKHQRRGESASSKAYREGRAVKYRGRIQGPVGEVKVYDIDELPTNSKLRR